MGVHICKKKVVLFNVAKLSSLQEFALYSVHLQSFRSGKLHNMAENCQRKHFS